MPRYDERSGPTRLYVGHIPRRTRSRDLHDLFSKYGRVRDVDMKTDYAFIDFSDPRDADDARHYLNGRSFDGSRIVVEFAKRGPRGGGGGGSRDYGGRGPAPGTGRCYNCGHDGHWARDCKAGDWKNKCYRCGQRGHIERNCTSSARNRSNSRSRSRSPSGGRRRSRSHSYSPKRSYSRSPVRKNGNSDGAEKKNRNDSLSRSPRRRSRSVSPARNGKSPKRSRSHSPDEQRPPRDQSASPVDNGKRAHSRTPSQSPIREVGAQDDISPAQNAQSPGHSGQSNSQSAD